MIKKENLDNNLPIQGVEIKTDILKEYPELEDITIAPTMEQQQFKSAKYGYDNVTVKAIQSEEIVIEPTQEEQVQEGMFHKVTVNPIVGDTLNITPTRNAQIFNGVFEEVNVSAIQTEEVAAELDFANTDTVEIIPSAGKFITKATVNKDVNLTANNIKSGVSINGISGNIADTNDADATAEDIVEGKTAYVANQKIRGAMPINNNNAVIEGSISSNNINGWKYLIKELHGDIIITATDAAYFFNGFSNLTIIENLDTSRIKNAYQLFYGCSNLVNIGIMNWSSIVIQMAGTNFQQVFTGCHNLSDESLNNIMASILTTTYKASSYMTLKYVGLSQEQAERCKSLSNYQALLDKGWTTGY